MKFRTILLCTIFFSCAAQQELTKTEQADTVSDSDSLSNYFLFEYIDAYTPSDYAVLLDSIRSGESENFFGLRMAYTKTSEYSPYETSTGDSLKKAENLIDSAEMIAALKVLREIQNHNYVHIRSHLYTGYIYEQLGELVWSNYHYKIYEGLLQSIYVSGDGESPKTAYLVISTTEEYDFLHWFRLQILRQSLIEFENYRFDLLEVTDPETAEEYSIYFNIEIPIKQMSNSLGH